MIWNQMNYCTQYFPGVTWCQEPEPVATLTDLEGAAINIELAIQQASNNLDVHSMKSLMLAYLAEAHTFLFHARLYQELVKNTANVEMLTVAMNGLDSIITDISSAADVATIQGVAHGSLYAFMGIIGGLFTAVSSQTTTV